MAALVGWLPGRALGAAASSPARSTFAVLLVAPVALPSYLLAWCWWQAVPPGSWLGDLAIRQQSVPLLRGACLALGLLCWGWPIAAWAVALLSRRSPEVAEAALLDGAGWRGRWRLAWHEDRGGLLLGAAAVGLLVFGNTTAFDLAQIRSFGFELRTLDARGAMPAQILAAAWPALVVALLGGAALWGLSRPPARDATGTARRSRGVGIIPWLLLAVSVGVPVWLMLRRLDLAGSSVLFMRLHGRALAHTILGAVTVGALAAVVASGLTMRVLSPLSWTRRLATVECVGWCLAAVLPASVVIAAMVVTFNRATTAFLYDSPIVAMLGQLAISGAVAALAARWAASTVPRERWEAMVLDGGATAAGRMRAAGPAIRAAAATAFGVAAALSLGEVAIGARLMPPNVPVLATSILNAVHYQDPETVMLATIMQIIAAVLVAALAVLVWRGAREGTTIAAGLRHPAAWALALVPLLVGCEPADGPAPTADWPVQQVFGNRGDGPGSFDMPRAIAVDGNAGRLYVVDKTARVQRFALDGRFELQWTMPEFETGKPTGISVGPDGTVWVADTHYHRVVAYDPEGHELLRFGSYGKGPGQFIYPTDVAIAPDGDIYVAEYGGNDRIQIFTPSGEFRFAFGRLGHRADDGGVEFRRPQAMVFGANGEELFIADSCNHRIVVVDRSGRLLRTLGGPGHGPGKFGYPYGLDRLPDGSLLVVEFGNQRAQRVSPQGEPLALWGTPGEARGQLRTPWGAAIASGTIFLLDSGNARVQVIPVH